MLSVGRVVIKLLHLKIFSAKSKIKYFWRIIFCCLLCLPKHVLLRLKLAPALVKIVSRVKAKVQLYSLKRFSLNSLVSSKKG